MADHEVLVGTIMKEERQRDLYNRQLLHEDVRDGIRYIPLDGSLPWSQQPSVNALLVKATDYLAVSQDGSPVLSHAVEQVRLQLALLAPMT